MHESVLLVGLGQIGMGYDLTLDPSLYIYTHARAFTGHPLFELVGAVDDSESRRRLFEDHYYKPAYEDLKEALEKHQPRVVVIATPTETHHLMVELVLYFSDPCVILCEKPLAYDLDEARLMVLGCQDAGVELFVNYIRRVDKGVLEVKRLLDEGAIVTPIKGNVWYSNGFLHNGSHFFNLMEFWLGTFVNAKILDPGRSWGEYDVEPDIHVEFERGKVVFRAFQEEAFSHYTIEMLSPSGRLRYEEGGSSISWQSTRPHPRLSGYTVLHAEPEIIENSMHHSQWHVVDQLACHLESKSKALCTGEQALETLAAMHQIKDLH